MEFYGRCIKTFLLCVCLGSCPKMLAPRKQNLRFVTVLGRMPAISPAAGEQYYLYLLFLSIPGATGFEDLRL